MTNENLDAINLTSSGSTCSSSSSSAASSTSNCSPNSTLNNSFNGAQSNTANMNTAKSQLNQQVDEMAVNFGLIMKDLKSVSTTLNLLARQIDQVVNKMDNKFNIIIKAIDLSNGGSNTLINTDESGYEESKKVIKVVNSNCNKKPVNTPTNGPNPASKPNVQNQTPSKKINGSLVENRTQQRAYSDRKVVNFNETDPAMFNYSNGKLLTDTLPTSHSHRLASSTAVAVAPSSRCNTLNGGTSIGGIVNGNPRIKCTRSKSQPAFKDGNYSYLVANMPMSDLPNKLSVFDSNRYTSSPVSNYQVPNDPSQQQAAQTSGCHLLLNQNNGTGSNENNPTESSFYEDQLDNELECISAQPTENNTNVTNSVMRNGQLARAPRAKSGNHVSFNINNAIYTSRQETPIPISVLKQQQQHPQINNSASYPNNTSYHPHLVKANIESNNIVKPILVQGGNHDSEIEIQGGVVMSPTTNASIKKSAGISDLLNQYVHQMSNDKDQNTPRSQQQQQQHLNKPVLTNSQPKVDTKTTIL